MSRRPRPVPGRSLLAAALLLGGCGLPGLEIGPDGDAPGDGAETAVVYPVPPEKPAAPEIGDGHDASPLSSFVGMTQDEVEARLGPAQGIRESAPARVWEYRTPTCALDFYFYMDLQSQQFLVLAYDLNTADGNADDDTVSLCLQALKGAARE